MSTIPREYEMLRNAFSVNRCEVESFVIESPPHAAHLWGFCGKQDVTSCKKLSVPRIGQETCSGSHHPIASHVIVRDRLTLKKE